VNIQAINGINSISKRASISFGQLHKVKPQDIQPEEVPQDTFEKSSGSRGMRRALFWALGLGLGATVFNSCVDAKSFSFADANAVAKDSCMCAGMPRTDTIYVTRHDTINNHDTIYVDTVITETKPVYVKEFPFHIADSLIRQGLNVGVPLDGPMPKDINNDVVFVSSNAFSCYDNYFYNTTLDNDGTNKDCLSLITKATDLYHDDNPQNYWIRTRVYDDPGVGLYFVREIAYGDKEPKPSDFKEWGGSETRTNLHNGHNKYTRKNTDGTIASGYYSKSLTGIPGAFTDDADVPYANPTVTSYNFDQANMRSERVKTIPKDQVPSEYWYIFNGQD
jgi:hypothetical protein